jgi:FkbM family methyltransferase
MFAAIAAGFKRRLARSILEPLLSARFMQRRALAILNRHFSIGELILCYKLNDHTLYLDPADDVITTNVLLKGSWQRENTERAIQILKHELPQTRGGVFVDIGANIGTQIIYAMLSGHFSSALAIEPDPANFALLQQNIVANKLKDRVKLRSCAAGSLAQTLGLQQHGTNKGAHAFDLLGHHSGETVPVRVQPLTDILAAANIDAENIGLIWIDVEGYELNVLTGMRELLAQQVPVVIEHDPARFGEENARTIHALLSANYDRVCRIDVSGRSPVAIDRMDPLQESGDFLFFSTARQRQTADKSLGAKPHRRPVPVATLAVELLHP